MSDGSPVPGELLPNQMDIYNRMSDRMSELINERDKWWNEFDTTRTELALMTAERDSLKAEVERLQREVARHRGAHCATINRMKPVVDAAVAYGNSTDTSIPNPAFVALMKATYAYQNTAPATSDSHEAVVDAALSEPVKTCTTCRWVGSRSVCGAIDCIGVHHNYRGWEVKE